MTSKREVDDDDDVCTTAEDNGKKRPKLPIDLVTGQNLNKDVVEHIEALAEEDIDSIKFYNNALRFEYKDTYNSPSENGEEEQEDEDEDEEEDQEIKFVELYWDNDGSKILKKVEGIHKHYCAKPEIEPNAARFLHAPITKETKYDNIIKEVDRQVKELLANGYKEVEGFITLHRVHLPCFTWEVSEEPPYNDGSAIVPVTSSQIGGNPAMYVDEEWPEGGQLFGFQINLATVPKRMQCIVGNEGLFQLFWNYDEWDESFSRIIPIEDFDKLERRLSSNINDDQIEFDLGSECIPKPGTITGWVERPDYPSSNDIDINNEEVRKMYKISERLRIDYDKFGGYGIYCQDGGAETLHNEACEQCNKNHLFSRETFNMFDGCMLRVGIGDMGTAQVSYCPNDKEKKIFIDAACY